MGAGMGSSASFAVALSAALKAAFKQVLDIDIGEVRDLADKMEAIFHTKPSGVDVAVCLLGGLNRFVKLDDGKISIERLEVVEVPYLVVIDSCVTRSTKTVVETLGQKWKED